MLNTHYKHHMNLNTLSTFQDTFLMTMHWATSVEKNLYITRPRSPSFRVLPSRLSLLELSKESERTIRLIWNVAIEYYVCYFVVK